MTPWRLKRGAVMMGNSPHLCTMIDAVRMIYGMLAPEVECVVVTGGCDGTHSVTSYHYRRSGGDLIGHDALDFRTRDVSDADIKMPGIVDAIQAHLGDDFDVIYEGTHLHIERDPKPA